MSASHVVALGELEQAQAGPVADAAAQDQDAPTAAVAARISAFVSAKAKPRKSKGPREGMLPRSFTPAPSPWAWRFELLLRVLRALPGVDEVANINGWRTRDRERPWRWTVEIALAQCSHGLATLFFLQLAEELKFADEYRPHWWMSGPTLLLSGDDDPARLALELLSSTWNHGPFSSFERCPVELCDSCPDLRPLKMTLPLPELFDRRRCP